MSSSRPLRIALPWHSFRSDNLGVGALALAHVAILRAAAARTGRSIELTVIGYDGRSRYIDAAQDVQECIIRGKGDWLPGGKVWQALRRADLVLDIGAGDSWADIYGAKRFFWQWISKQLPLMSGVPVVLAPQTIGPFDHMVSRALARRTMRRCAHIFARDAESLALLAALGIDHIEETADVAFRLPFERRARSEGRISFGFNISGLLYGGGYTGKDQLGSRDAYRAMADGIMEGLLARGDTDIVLVPHVVPNDGSREDDVAVSRALAARYPAVSVAPVFGSPTEAKSFISGLDILAGSRMHATIAAASSGTAVVPLAYSRKFRGVFSSIGYPLVGDCTTMPADELVGMTLGAVDRRLELAAAAERGNAIAQRKLDGYEAFLAKIIAEHPSEVARA